MTDITVEESDELLRQSIEAIESGTNDSEDVEEESEEVEVTTEEEAEEVEEVQLEKKTKSNIPKLLHEKNEWKRKALESEARIAELEADGGTDKEYLQEIAKKAQAENMETYEFYRENPEAKAMKEDIEFIQSQYPNMSIDKAYRNHLMDTNPSMLLDKQTRNKMSNSFAPVGNTAKSVQKSPALDYSMSELDGLIAAGKIRL